MYFCLTPKTNHLEQKIMHSDLDLLTKSKKGDETAFRTLVLRYEQQVRATVRGMLGNVGEADDVAQEVFIRFYKAMPDFRGEAALGTYLTRIAINLSLNELKRKQRKNRWMTFFQRGDKTSQIEDTTAHPDRQDTKELVRKALQILEPDFRSVVILRMLDGYSVKETAEILQLPMGTIASRLARAQKKLKVILQGLSDETKSLPSDVRTLR